MVLREAQGRHELVDLSVHAQGHLRANKFAAAIEFETPTKIKVHVTNGMTDVFFFRFTAEVRNKELFVTDISGLVSFKNPQLDPEWGISDKRIRFGCANEAAFWLELELPLRLPKGYIKCMTDETY